MKSLLNKFQQRYLWFKIIVEWFNQENAEKFNLIENSSYCWKLAAKATDAWYILNRTGIEITDYLSNIVKNVENQEIQNFSKWANSYKLICEQSGYVDELPEYIPLNTNIKNSDIKCFKIECTDFINELNTAAAWSKNESITNKNIGILILNLEQEYIKLQVDYVFSNFLDDTSYNISVPHKLNSYPVIKIILLILKIANCCITNNNISYQDFSILLRTKFIKGYDVERSARHYMDYLLRKKLDYEFNWEYLISQLQDHNLYANCEVFLQLMHDFHQELQYLILNDYNCHAWANSCNKILQLFGFGVIKNWHHLLENYIKLDPYVGKHNLSECIKILTYFSEDLDEININIGKSNINIITLETALRSKFDCLWICGSNDINWLDFNDFNPFISINLQKNNSHNAEGILKQLINNTSKLLMCSYSLYVEGNLVSCNRLINNFFDFKYDANNNLEHIQPECYQDYIAPQYNSNVFSGTNFLKLQAACPFKANAKIRLQADSLQSPSFYLDGLIKGEMIHKVMERFWCKYKHNDIVKNLTDHSIYQELLIIINNVLDNLKQLKPVTLNNVFMQVEGPRIADLCFNFIKKCDLLRENFTVVYLEHKFTVQLEEVCIKIKIDRIDSMNDSLIIIDYKTGKSLININHLEDLRIDEPQLLIYSLCFANVTELMLALVTNQPKFIKIANWLDLKDLWYKNLYKTAKNFQAGIALVDPKYGKQTCRLCDLKYMCRIFEKSKYLE